MKRYVREKDYDRLRLKIEEAINILSLEHYLDLPDWYIAEKLANYFNELAGVRQGIEDYKTECALNKRR